MESFAYFAHQPILTRDKKLHAYELLFRNSDENIFPANPVEDATDSLIANSVLGQTLDMLSPSARCFVNFPLKSIIDGLPSLLSPKRLVVEVLESVEPCVEVLDAISSLRKNGYVIALDDYCHHPEWEKNLDLIDIIKFDLTAQSWAELVELKTRFERPSLKFLAEKVETHEEFEKTLNLGFDFFQGYFFSKPTLVKHKPIGASELTIMRLLNAVSHDDIDFNVVEQLLRSDVVLSYKLLNVVNNKLGFLASRIDSLRQAAVYLGNVELRKFVSLVGTRAMSSEQPIELSQMAMARGFYCESMLRETLKSPSTEGFMLGLFSLLDVILGQPLEALLEHLPLSEKLKQSLITGKGVEAQVLRLCITHEQANWDEIEQHATALNISSDKSYRAFANAGIQSFEMIGMLE